MKDSKKGAVLVVLSVELVIIPIVEFMTIIFEDSSDLTIKEEELVCEGVFKVSVSKLIDNCKLKVLLLKLKSVKNIFTTINELILVTIIVKDKELPFPHAIGKSSFTMLQLLIELKAIPVEFLV